MPARKSLQISLALFVAMCALSVAAVTLRPDKTAAQAGQRIVLETAVPKDFGGWRELKLSTQVVNPQTEKLLNSIYSQILSRVYENDRGYRIMLSIAYGDDQRGGLQAHKPEVCYPAQGFKLEEQAAAGLATAWGTIETTRLRTSLGPRLEPITYWMTNGDRVVRNQWDRRLEQFRLALTGQIPDGLIFRVSSIDANAPRAFAEQAGFVNDLLATVAPESRRRLSGLQPVQP